MFNDFFFIFQVISFNSNGKVKIHRSQEIPKSLERATSQFTGINGNWKLIDYPKHPECIGYQFSIEGVDQNTYNLHAHVINSLNCHLEYNPVSNQWKTSGIMTTLMAGPPEEMQKESLISDLISGIQRVDTSGPQNLLIQTNNGEQARLERFTVPPPTPVTQNIFN